MDPTKETLLHAVVYFALWTLAVADPLYSVLVQSPEFFTAHRASGASLLLASLAISLVVPGLFFLTDVGLSRLHRPAGSAFRRAISLILLVSIAFRVSASLPLSSSVRIAVALLCVGVGAYWLLPSRSSDLMKFALAPIVLISPAYWYVASGIHETVGEPEGVSVALPAGREPNGTPVVFIILDQLATTAIIDGKGGIDPDRFPALADLIDSATWYRNATTVATQTLNAVPAILTGNRPRSSRTSPALKFHPRNLFALMHGRYEFNVFESVTTLSPADDEYLRKSDLDIAKSMLADCAVVAGHIVLPSVLGSHLPAVDGQPAFFAVEPDPDPDPTSEHGKGDLAALYGWKRHEQVRAFLAEMDGGDRTLHFIHHMSPHHPWQFFPSNDLYSKSRFVPGLPSWDRQWPTDPGVATAARQRYLLQTLGLDKTIGEIVSRMRKIGLFDKSMLVLVADHGNNFTPNVQLRRATPQTYRDVIYVPLMIKYPHQEVGRVVDENIETIDIVPTIAEVLGMQIPPTDGESLLSSSRVARPRKRVLTESATGEPVEFPAVGGGEILEAGTLFDGMVFSPDDRWVRVQSACSHLLGEELGSASTLVKDDGRVSLRLNSDDGGYRHVGMAEYENGWIVGRLEGELAQEQEVLIAVTQAGSIVALGRTFSSPEAEHEFSLLVPESVRDRRAALRVHVLDPKHPECGATSRHRVFADSGLAFGPEDPGDSYGIGWSVFESAPEHALRWRWAMGPKASLFLDLPQRSVALRFRASTHAANPEQELTAVVNGSVVGKVRVSTRRMPLVDIVVPASVIGPEASRIELLFGQSNQPQNGDKRNLSVKFESLEVIDAQEADPAAVAAPRD